MSYQWSTEDQPHYNTGNSYCVRTNMQNPISTVGKLKLAGTETPSGSLLGFSVSRNQQDVYNIGIGIKPKKAGLVAHALNPRLVLGGGGR